MKGKNKMKQCKRCSGFFRVNWLICLLHLPIKFCQICKKYNLDYGKLDDIEVEGIDMKDYPDFCDAYIARGTYEDREMTDREIDWLNQDKDFVYQKVEEHLY